MLEKSEGRITGKQNKTKQTNDTVRYLVTRRNKYRMSVPVPKEIPDVCFLLKITNIY